MYVTCNNKFHNIVVVIACTNKPPCNMTIDHFEVFYYNNGICTHVLASTFSHKYHYK
jgi:hypothetical protein